MIAEHQPTIFGSDLDVRLTSVKDGTMSYRTAGAPESDDEVAANRRKLFDSCGYILEDGRLVYVTYADENGVPIKNFCRYGNAESLPAASGMIIPGSGTPFDALVTSRPGEVLMLPIADCVATVISSQSPKLAMLSHIGRHSAEQAGASHSISHLVERYGCDPKQLKVWLSPAAGGENYHCFNSAIVACTM